jgi:MFS family permease
MPYLIIYYEVSLEMDNYVLIMAPAIILASVFTAFYGRLYDKHGFTKTIFPAVIILSLGYVLLFFFKDVVLVFIGSLLMMSGYLAGMAIFGALIREKIPENKSGMFQGLRIVGQVLIPGVIGPMIGSGVLADAEKIVGNDGTESFIPNEKIFLAALIVSVAVILYLILFGYLSKKIEAKGATEVSE